MAEVVRFRSAVALIGRFPVLAGVDLDVAAGQIVLLEGPNGAGKTSLLRACCGLLTVARGEACVLGHDLLAKRPAGWAASVGFLGHDSGLYEDLTVNQNLEFRLAVSRRTNPSDLTPTQRSLEFRSAGDLLREAELPPRLGSVKVHLLSEGQRRRVALAAMAARSPKLWLLDEPQAGLDAGARRRLEARLVTATANGSAILVASHEPGALASLAHHRVRIEDGKTSIHVS